MKRFQWLIPFLIATTFPACAQQRTSVTASAPAAIALATTSPEPYYELEPMKN